MTNKQILEIAIQKAIDGGWQFESLIPWRDGYGVQKLKSLEHLKEFDVEHIIFNHDFAKALWGEPRPFMETGFTKDANNLLRRTEGWQHHLQQMVISEDPVKYLGEHL